MYTLRWVWSFIRRIVQGSIWASCNVRFISDRSGPKWSSLDSLWSRSPIPNLIEIH